MARLHALILLLRILLKQIQVHQNLVESCSSAMKSWQLPTTYPVSPQDNNFASQVLPIELGHRTTCKFFAAPKFLGRPRASPAAAAQVHVHGAASQENMLAVHGNQHVEI